MPTTQDVRPVKHQYIVCVNGAMVGARKTLNVYTHAVVAWNPTSESYEVWSFCGSMALARKRLDGLQARQAKVRGEAGYSSFAGLAFSIEPTEIV